MTDYTEEWLIRVDNQNFTTDQNGKDKVIHAMQENKRFVSISSKDIISVRHISYIYMTKKEIANQLPEGEKKEVPFEPIPLEKWKQIKKEAYSKIGRKK